MTGAVYDGSFFLGITSPKYEYKAVTVSVEFTDCSIGKLFPTLSLMRTGLTGTDRQSGVQKQHTLLRPTRQVAAYRNRFAQVIAYLLENITERGRKRHAVVYRKAQAVRLTRLVIRILSYYDNLDLIEWTQIKGIEYQIESGA